MLVRMSEQRPHKFDFSVTFDQNRMPRLILQPPDRVRQFGPLAHESPVFLTISGLGGCFSGE